MGNAKIEATCSALSLREEMPVNTLSEPRMRNSAAPRPLAVRAQSPASIDHFHIEIARRYAHEAGAFSRAAGCGKA